MTDPVTDPQSLAIWNQSIRHCTDPLPGSIPYENRRLITVLKKFDRWTLGEFLPARFPHVDAAIWRQRCCNGLIRYRDTAVSSEHVVRAGNVFDHSTPDTIEPHVSNNVWVLYEDSSIVVIDKPAPLPVHPSGRFNKNTLISFLQRSRPNHHFHIVHRLDSDTTGIMVMVKTKEAASTLRKQFDENTVGKTYLARTKKIPDHETFTCSHALSKDPVAQGARTLDDDGVPAHTDFIRLGSFPDRTALIKVVPRTGRTNQIRLHLKSLGYPIVGDRIYDVSSGTDTQTEDHHRKLCLHALAIGFLHPQTGEVVEFHSERPGWANGIRQFAG